MEDTPGTMRWEDGRIEIERIFFFFSCVSGFQFLSVKRAAKCESDFFYEENLVVSSKRKKKK